MEKLIIENANKGRIISHIFRLKGREGWSVGIKHERGHIDIGEGDTPSEAMQHATDRANGLMGRENRPVPKFTKPQKEESLEDLL